LPVPGRAAQGRSAPEAANRRGRPTTRVQPQVPAACRRRAGGGVSPGRLRAADGGVLDAARPAIAGAAAARRRGGAGAVVSAVGRWSVATAVGRIRQLLAPRSQAELPNAGETAPASYPSRKAVLQ